jgi:hypothetical protein
MIVSNLRNLPRLMSAHQLARRAGVHRSALTALMLRGQLQPFALQDVGSGREQFLFAADAAQTVARLAAAERTGTTAASHPLL